MKHPTLQKKENSIVPPNTKWRLKHNHTRLAVHASLFSRFNIYKQTCNNKTTLTSELQCVLHHTQVQLRSRGSILWRILTGISHHQRKIQDCHTKSLSGLSPQGFSGHDEGSVETY